MDKNNCRPKNNSKNKDIKTMAQWISHQLTNYKKNVFSMKNEKIKSKWIEFVNDPKYEQYFLSGEEQWFDSLKNVKQYMDKNNCRPNSNSKNKNIKIMGIWIGNQLTKYKKNIGQMKDEKIKNKWIEFVKEYLNKPSKKSVNIKPKTKSTIKTGRKRPKDSNYQKIGRQMSSQKSETTNKMFQENKDLWHQYHNDRDFSFEGYDKQEEIPINKIINYLEKKRKRKLKILDLGCGRNKIYHHFKDNKKFIIKGYDHISCNDSIERDISNLEEDDESINICIYSQ